MRRIVGASLSFLFILSLAPHVDGQGKPATPAEQFKAIRKEYDVAASGSGTTDDDRRKSIARVDQLRPGIAQKFVDLAAKYPKDPIAVDALIEAIWMVNGNSFPIGGNDNPGFKAMTLLLRDYSQSDKLGPICQRLTTGFRPEYELFLRTLLEKNQHKNVQALACLSLAQFLNNRAQRMEQIKEQPEQLKDYEAIFGKEYLADLQRRDRTKWAKEIEVLFERAGSDFADEKIPYSGTVGPKARAELFEFRNLLVGKEAPDIEGEDQDGKRFKLSDYRGKVVLIDFWNRY